MTRKKKKGGSRPARKKTATRPAPRDEATPPREKTPAEQAQDLMWEAWDSPEPERRIELAQEAISISPDCVDAYLILALDFARSPQEMSEYYGGGVRAGTRALGKRLGKGGEESLWDGPIGRAYLRARSGLAECLWMTGRRADAVEHYWEMLRLNPEDHQGIRHSLAPLLYELQYDGELMGLLQQYADDPFASMAFTSALLAFRQEGDSPHARELLGKACNSNEYVAAYLTEAKPMPSELPIYMELGDENEAVDYVIDAATGWKMTPGAIEWLAAHVSRA